MNIKELISIHKEIEERIGERIRIFKSIWDNNDKIELFMELVFCILTPQSRARAAEKSIKQLLTDDNIFNAGGWEEISPHISSVRFSRNKSKYILEARGKFMKKETESLRAILEPMEGNLNRRDWIVENVKGIGLKEGSHFLRNIGMGQDLAILDRHILKNLVRYGVIDSVPTLSRKNYLDIEKKMANFAKKVGVPFDHLDFVWWYSETKDIFK